MAAPVVTTWALERSILLLYGLFAGAAGLATLATLMFKRETLGVPLAEFPEDIVEDGEQQSLLR